MDTSARSLLTSAVAAVGITAVALTPAAPPLHAQLVNPAVHLTAAAQPVDPDPLASALVSTQQLQPAVADAAIFAPEAATVVSTGEIIKAVFGALVFLGRLDVFFASYAIGSVPIIGLAAPQLGIAYGLDVSLTGNLLFNTVDVFDGDITPEVALSNIAASIAEAFDAFVNSEIDWVDGLLSLVL